MWAGIKREIHLFLDATEKGNEKFYLVLFTLFVISHVVLLMGWKSSLNSNVWQMHHILFAIVMWGSAVYLFSVLADWRKAWNRTGEMIVIGVIVFMITAAISRIVTTDSYTLVMGLFFCLMAAGKNYKRLLLTLLILFVATILFGLLGMQIGITVDAMKPNRLIGGHSLGIIYPNHWGSFAFAILILIWYLFLQNRRILSFIIFWGTAVFMYKYITCYTIAGMAILFPVLGLAAELLQQKKAETVSSDKKALSIIVISLPFIFMAVMLILCWQMDWIHDTFYETPLRSFAMRFVEGGYSLMRNGVSLFGHPFEQWDASLVSYSNEIELIVDSAYICYLIIRGIVAMILTLGWISFAHYRCLKKNDYRLIVISFFMLLFSMMERPGLDAWFNFVMLYPLTSLTTDKGMSESDLGITQ